MVCQRSHRVSFPLKPSHRSGPVYPVPCVAAWAQRTRPDGAHWLRDRYLDAERVTRVLDHLHTHHPASLYATFPPADAEALARRLPDRDTLQTELAAWTAARRTPVRGPCTPADARTRLHHLYPTNMNVFLY